jgi:hypothetical protein
VIERLGYRGLCVVLGLVVGWFPMLLHGPIPQKFDVLYINGSIAVWGFYGARLLIGLLVGITTWPERWWLRGPLCGFLLMLPPGIVLLGVPGCGGLCTLYNLLSATGIGTIVAGGAWLATGRDHANGLRSTRTGADRRL